MTGSETSYVQYLHKIIHSSRLPFLLGLIIVLLYIAPVLIQWEDAPVLNHDCLDSNVVWYLILGQSGKLFGSYDGTIEQIMGGISRNSFPSEFNVVTLLFTFFEPITAYFLNFSIIHLIAFIGMFFFLREFYPGGKEYRYLIPGVSCAFALLPFYPPAGLSIAGLPLMLYGFFSLIRDGWRLWSLLPLILYSFYSSGVFTGYFLLPILFLYCVLISVYQRKVLWRGIYAIFFAGLLFLICDYRLFWEMFLNNSSISHRVEFSSIGLPFIDTFQTGYGMLSSGQYHAESLHQLIVPVLWVSLALMVIHQLGKKRDINRYIIYFGTLLSGGLILSHLTSRVNGDLITLFLWSSIIFFLFLLLGLHLKGVSKGKFLTIEWIIVGLTTLVFLFSFIYQVSTLDLFLFIKSQFFVLNALQMRFYTLLPVIWYLIFGICSIYILERSKKLKIFVYGVILIQIIFLFSFQGGTYQTGGYGNLQDGQYSFNEFYSPDVFESIRDEIGINQSSYRVGSIGIHPAISQYNGFYTVDGYFANYLLQYKHQFREIIAPELNKSERWRVYFDGWGSRAYIFSSELDGTSYSKGNGIVLQDLDLNITAFKNLGGKYIFSAVEIDPVVKGLSLEGVYSSEKSPWEIRVYSVQ
ncbi:hypothetical protein Mhun_3099 [Methanospirillum hungatei JF-1]|uniref:Uncharacterized protein n=1 Tax=Methanospirillum hungatei JF-1 (strain ATCC 27890 / DSM 864 / NBRC 100397 / JF-1) TaxID=323259 RepID=Q2FUN5_METHJ|nr:DUF6044 family protein [Methanospirillum hungatei]ABD42786.1 hypothetical protein Mhun_3099 [Methanospirillum hungatei JF-1]